MPEASAAPAAALEMLDTGPIHAAVQGMPSAKDVALEVVKLAGGIVGGGGGGGGGDGGKPIDVRKFRAGNWAVQLVIGVAVVVGTAFTTYKATETRSVENQKAIRAHVEEPMHEAAAKRVDDIDRDVQQIKIEISGKNGQGGIKGDVKAIAAGVNQLKQEAKTEKQQRLERELERLRRENRRLERQR